MVNIEPSSDFQNEIKETQVEPVISKPTEPQPISPVSTVPITAVPISQTDIDEANAEALNARRWKTESTIITIFALLIIAGVLYEVIPVLIADVDYKAKFFVALVFGIPGVLSLFLLRRSDMARIITMAFMVLFIALQFFPGAVIHLYVIIIALAVLIFLNNERIKRHFV